VGDKYDEIKRRTIEIYDSLPQEKSERIRCLAERDQILELNINFFSYIAANKFLNNSFISYEDKFQSACCHFLDCWWWYKWKGDATHKAYRDDLSFTVFFKPRITEMMEREFNEVKYSIRRSLCMIVGEQIGKHWAQVRYEDLSDPRVHLPADKMISLKACFGSLYQMSISDVEPFLSGESYEIDGDDEFEMSCMYNTVEELLAHEMMEAESKLTDKQLIKMADMYQLDINVLRDALPRAELLLYNRLKKSLESKL